MTTRLKLAFTASLMMLLCACGQRGPLYLPEPESAPQNTPSETSSLTLVDKANIFPSPFSARAPLNAFLRL